VNRKFALKEQGMFIKLHEKSGDLILLNVHLIIAITADMAGGSDLQFNSRSVFVTESVPEVMEKIANAEKVAVGYEGGKPLFRKPDYQ
jgi:hypothetical protein